MATSGLILAAMLAGGTGGDTLSAVVREYYDRLLAGKVVSYTLELRRPPQTPAEGWVVTAVEGDESIGSVPRGNRLCRVRVQEGKRGRVVPVTVRIRTVELVPTARRELSARTVLADSLVDFIVRPTDDLGSAEVINRQALTSYWTKTRIPAGAPLTMDKLQAIPDVRAGQSVMLVSVQGGAQVRTSGKSLRDARVGERLVAVCDFSGRRLQGVLQPGGVVLVQ